MSTARRLRIVYILTVVLAGSAGIAILMAPESVYEFYQLDSGYHLFVGLTGTIWTSFAICSALALHCPIRYSPLVLIQLMYKAIWLVLIVLPCVVTQEFPPQMIGHAISFLLVVLLDLWAIPWGYLFQDCEPDGLND